MSQLGLAQCILLGRLTRDPGHRREGQDPVNCGVAVNHTKDRVSFFELELWGDGATNFRAHAKKGDQVLFVCEPYVSEWKGKDGGARKDVRFKVHRWQFTGGGSGEKQHPAPAATLQEARERQAAIDDPRPADTGLSADDLMGRL